METIAPVVPQAVGMAPNISLARKKPGLAFLLSLVVPGAGHVYCGNVRNGVLTFAFFGASLAGAVFLPPTSMVWGFALRAVLVLYTFAFLDAFFSAREFNAGISSALIGTNPRIAATLNLLTNGLGYFYLGERKKGLICFFTLRIVAAAVTNVQHEVSVAGSVGLELIYTVLAIDAYRIARRQLQEACPEQPTNPFALPATEGLSAAVPVTLACLFVFNYVALVTIGIVMPDYSKLDRASAKVSITSTEKVYAHPLYGIEVHIPSGWEFDNNNTGTLVYATRTEGGCNVQLTPTARLPLRSIASDADEVGRELVADKAHAYRVRGRRATSLGSLDAQEINLGANFNGTEIVQQYVLAQKRLTLYVFLVSMAAGMEPECWPEVEGIRQHTIIR